MCCNLCMVMIMTEHDEWLKKRLHGIGGSDAAAVVGMSPYKTNVELWEEKTGRAKAPDISFDSHVQYGKKAEVYLRELFKLDFSQYRVDYDEFGMIANNPDMPFAFATLDGALTDPQKRHGVLEIKTVEILRAGQWKEWDGRIPQHYYIQVIHQLLATGYDFAILKAQIKYTGRDGSQCAAIRHYPIERTDVLDDIAWIEEREKTFWGYVEHNERPPLILPEF